MGTQRGTDRGQHDTAKVIPKREAYRSTWNTSEPVDAPMHHVVRHMFARWQLRWVQHSLPQITGGDCAVWFSRGARSQLVCVFLSEQASEHSVGHIVNSSDSVPGARNQWVYVLSSEQALERIAEHIVDNSGGDPVQCLVRWVPRERFRERIVKDFIHVLVVAVVPRK